MITRNLRFSGSTLAMPRTTGVAALRSYGASVHCLHAAEDGCPDLLVGWHRTNLLMEVKTKSGELTPRQREFLSMWRGQVVIVHTPE